MGATGAAILDFGAFPGSVEASVAVVGQAGIVAGSLVEAWRMPTVAVGISPINYQQRDTPAIGFLNCNTGKTVNSASLSTKRATEGGTPGTGTPTLTIDASAVDKVALLFECVVGLGIWNGGTWTIRLRITTANANLTWESVSISRVSTQLGSCQALMGQTNGLGISLATTGVKSATITTTAQRSLAGDLAMVVLGFSNAVASTQAFNFTPDQLIDSPITAMEGHEGDEQRVECLRVIADTIVVGTGFTIRGFNDSSPAWKIPRRERDEQSQRQRVYGKFNIGWAWI